MKIDKFAENALKEFLSPDEIKEAVWQHKQSGQYIAKHKWLEIVATKAGITFSQPTIVETRIIDKACVVIVTGTHKERTEWSFGESAPYNTQIGYPYSMAEKRAKDRVILKLLGLHGFIYSEEEADDFKEQKEPKSKAPKFNNGKSPTELGFKNATEFKKVYTEKIDKLNKLEQFNPDIERSVDEFQEKVSAYDPEYGEAFRSAVENAKRRINNEFAPI